MQSSFIYLRNKKLVLRQDQQLYQDATSTLYKKQSFKFMYSLLLAKLYDMSNFPIHQPTKMYIYIGVIMGINCISFYYSSLPIASMLVDLDNKYQPQYKQYVKSNAYQGLP